MSDKSAIEWTDASWNPVRGCVKVSPGCKHCYAETFAERWRGIPGHPYEQGFDLKLVPEKLGEPLKWRRPRRVFVNSMSDLFQDGVSFEYIAACYGVMALAKQHTFQILTKRAERRGDWHRWIASDGSVFRQGKDGVRETLPTVQRCITCASAMDAGPWNGPMFSAHFLSMVKPKDDAPIWDAWPLPNVWEGVSVEDRKYGVPRIEHLRNTPAAVRFLSIEPLLEDIGEINLDGIHWVIVGAESGRGARPMQDDWVRSIRDQALAAGCKFFFKQRAERGRKISLPLLDGKRWAEFPA